MNKQVLEVYYDGSCSLCRAEIDTIRSLAIPGTVRFTDCAAADFDAALLPAGIGKADLLRELHARDADGTWFRGAEANAQLYRRAGLLLIARVWEHQLAGALLRSVYPWIIRNRHWLGRLGFPALLEWVIRVSATRAQRHRKSCADGACAIAAANRGGK